jgi:hypothetical protein
VEFFLFLIPYLKEECAKCNARETGLKQPIRAGSAATGWLKLAFPGTEETFRRPTDVVVPLAPGAKGEDLIGVGRRTEKVMRLPVGRTTQREEANPARRAPGLHPASNSRFILSSLDFGAAIFLSSD